MRQKCNGREEIHKEEEKDRHRLEKETEREDPYVLSQILGGSIRSY